MNEDTQARLTLASPQLLTLSGKGESTPDAPSQPVAASRSDEPSHTPVTGADDGDPTPVKETPASGQEQLPSEQPTSEPLTATPNTIVLEAELAGATLPMDLAALDAALADFLRGLEDTGQVIRETVGGIGVAPWLAALAALLTVYETARRRRASNEVAALVEALPGSGA